MTVTENICVKIKFIFNSDVTGRKKSTAFEYRFKQENCDSQSSHTVFDTDVTHEHNSLGALCTLIPVQPYCLRWIWYVPIRSMSNAVWQKYQDILHLAHQHAFLPNPQSSDRSHWLSRREHRPMAEHCQSNDGNHNGTWSRASRSQLFGYCTRQNILCHGSCSTTKSTTTTIIFTAKIT